MEVDQRGAAVVVTNYHVVDQGGAIQVSVNDSALYPAKYLGYDIGKDLAALEICCSAQFRAAYLADRRLTPGDSVFAMGYPLGIDQASITSGVVSRLSFDGRRERWMVQTDAPINPGNSGGPLFTLDGEIVGINTSVVRESSTGEPVEGFGFAVSALTVAGALHSLKSGSIGAPPTATPTPTPRPGGAGVRFGLVDGSLDQNQDDFIEEFSAGVSLSDFVAVAAFDNPSAGENWDYGFMFRDSGKDQFSALVVSGDGQWGHYLRDGDPDSDLLLDSGLASGLKTRAGDSNEIRIVALEEVGLFFLNGKLISSLTLPEGSERGDVSAIRGYYTGHEVTGRSTVFRGFRVSEPEWMGTEDGELAHDNDGNIKSFYMLTEVKDFIAQAIFFNPYSRSVGPWSYGLAFRHSATNRFQAVVMASDGTWEHWVREGSFSPVHEERGRARLNLGSGGQNKILLLAIGGTALLNINGEFIAELDIGLGPEEGDVWVGTGFYSGNEVPGYNTRFEDFEVWSLD